VSDEAVKRCGMLEEEARAAKTYVTQDTTISPDTPQIPFVLNDSDSVYTFDMSMCVDDLHRGLS
jgi:hypothetical protein